jgi:hypothetical protein
MKKYTLGLLAVVLAVFASAFSVKSSPQTNQSDLYWFDHGNTVQSISSVDVATQTDEETNVCPGSGRPCKDGYTSVTDLGNGNYQAGGTKTSISKQ